MDICQAARKNSGWVWSSLRQARRLKTKLGKESITDFFLLNLRKVATRKLDIKSFTRHEEAQSGSDWEWEWWLTGPSNKWLGMRIQAKVISLDTDCYQHLHYIPKRGVSQVDTLIESASKDNKIPIYCLYSHWSTRKRDYKNAFSQCHQGLRGPDFGVSIVDALEIRSLSQNGKPNDLLELLPHMKPLHHLFCSESKLNYELPEVIIDNLNRLRFGDLTQRQLSSEALQYVYALQEAASNQKIVDDNQLRELFPDDNLRTLTIFEQK